jgi:ferrous iron transport protein A
MEKKNKMVLLDTTSGMSVKIVGFKSGYALESKLRQLGIFPGDTAKVIRHAPLGGPFLIEINGREIALSRTIVSKIAVEEVECVSP